MRVDVRLEEARRGRAVGNAAPIRVLLPFTAVVFLGFLAIGIPLPVLPLYVHDVQGFGPLVVGAAIGVQSLATLLTRPFAGRLCAAWGARRTVIWGLAAVAGSGLLYLASYRCTPGAAGLPVLIAGRILLGFGESLFITGTAVWSIARVGPALAGRAMAWQGMAMYGAMAVGAPLGGVVLSAAGFPAVAALVILMPLGGACVAWLLAGVPAEQGSPVGFT